MSLLDRFRDPKPRLKPGITYFRLIVFVVAALALSVVMLNVATGKYPERSDCNSKGIDPRDLQEGTCTEEGATIVVVDRHGTLKLETLSARLLAVRYRKVGPGPGPSGPADDRLITFELSIENLTDDPASVGEGQFVLYADKTRTEAVGFDEDHEPRSFLAQGLAVPAGGSARGTVSFRLPAGAARAVRTSGNLDVVNLGSAVSADRPEAIFSEDERGVIRIYH